MCDNSSTAVDEEIRLAGELPTLPLKMEENAEISSSAPSRRRLRNNNSISKQECLQPEDESPREVRILLGYISNYCIFHCKFRPFRSWACSFVPKYNDRRQIRPFKAYLEALIIYAVSRSLILSLTW